MRKSRKRSIVDFFISRATAAIADASEHHDRQRENKRMNGGGESVMRDKRRRCCFSLADSLGHLFRSLARPLSRTPTRAKLLMMKKTETRTRTENRVMDSRRRMRKRSGRGEEGPSNSEAIYGGARRSHSFSYQGNRSSERQRGKRMGWSSSQLCRTFS